MRIWPMPSNKPSPAWNKDVKSLNFFYNYKDISGTRNIAKPVRRLCTCTHNQLLVPVGTWRAVMHCMKESGYR